MRKYIGCLIGCALSISLFAGCAEPYIVKPAGTNKALAADDFEVPEKYRRSVNEQGDTVEESSHTDEKSRNDTGNAAVRKEQFLEQLASEELYVDIKRVRTYGDSSESARLLCVYSGEKVYVAVYNSSGAMEQEVIGEGETVYLIDRYAEKKLETSRETYKYCNRAALSDLFSFDGAVYSESYPEEISGRTLQCDEYSAPDSVIRYYYDTAGNLIVIRETSDDDERVTVFTELSPVIPDDFWDTHDADYAVEKLILP